MHVFISHTSTGVHLLLAQTHTLLIAERSEANNRAVCDLGWLMYILYIITVNREIFVVKKSSSDRVPASRRKFFNNENLKYLRYENFCIVEMSILSS